MIALFFLKKAGMGPLFWLFSFPLGKVRMGLVVDGTHPWQLLQSCCCLRWLYYGFIACLPLSRQSLRIAEDFADAVLEVAGITGAHHPPVE